MERPDEGLVPSGLHVFRPVAVTRGADLIARGALVGGAVGTRVGITREDLGLVVAVGARGAGLHLRGSRTGWWSLSLGRRNPRREYGEGGGGEGSGREVLHGLASLPRVNFRDVEIGSGAVAGAAGLGRDGRVFREVRRVEGGVGENVAAVMAARAGGRRRTHRREEVAIRHDRLVRDRKRERVGGRTHVAREAVAAIAGIPDLVEAARQAGVAVDRVVLGQLFTRVDAVDHARELDRLAGVRRAV